MAQRRYSPSPRLRSRRREDGDGALVILVLFVAYWVWQFLAGIDLRSLVVGGALLITLCVVIARIVVLAARQRRREVLLREEALALDPTDFERRVQAILQDLGWERVRHRGGAGDGGVDLRGVRGGEEVIVQCKRYKGVVAPGYVRELFGALGHDRATRALLVTTGTFSDETRRWVGTKPIELWDGAELARQTQRAAELRAGPAASAGRRRRSQRFYAALAAFNALALLVALLLPDNAPVATPFRGGAPAPSPTLRPVPTGTPVARSPVTYMPTATTASGRPPSSV